MCSKKQRREKNFYKNIKKGENIKEKTVHAMMQQKILKSGHLNEMKILKLDENTI